MKKLFLMASMLVCCMMASAQINIVPKVGLTLATITNADNTKMKAGLVAGAEAEYSISDAFLLSGGLLYSMQGCGIKDAKNTNLDYLNIPVLAQYKITPALTAKAGLQPGFLMSAKYDGTDVKDAYETFDMSIPLGLSYQISDFVIDARYNLGLNKVNKVGDSCKNSVFMITVGYNIPL